MGAHFQVLKVSEWVGDHFQVLKVSEGTCACASLQHHGNENTHGTNKCRRRPTLRNLRRRTGCGQGHSEMASEEHVLATFERMYYQDAHAFARMFIYLQQTLS